MSSKELVIVGCGGHGRTTLDVILEQNPDAEIVFVDPQANENETITTNVPSRTFKVLREVEPASNREFFVAIGDNQRRLELREALGDIALAKVVAQNAQIGTDAEIGDGSFIGHQAVVGPFSKVGEGVIINTRSHISHEVEIGHYSQLTLDVTVGGRTKIGDNVLIGMRSSIFDGLEICSDTVIGANSLVNRDIKEAGTYMGIPARRVK